MKGKRIRLPLAIVVILLFLVPSVAAASSQGGGGSQGSAYSFIHYSFQSSELWKRGYLPVEGSVIDELRSVIAERRAVLEELGVIKGRPAAGERAVRAFILAPPSASEEDIERIAGYTSGVIGVFPTHAYTIIYAWLTKSDVERFSRLPIAVAAVPEAPLQLSFEREAPELSRRSLAAPGWLEAMGGSRPEPQQLQAPAGEGAYHYTVYLTGAARVWEQGFTGSRATIGVVDTGVDYASPALGPDALARDPATGLPLILDDSLGIALAPVEVTLSPVTDAQGNIVRVDALVDVASLYIYDPIFGWVEPIDYGFAWALDYVVFDITAFEVPQEVYDAYLQGAAPPRFGLIYQVIYAPKLLLFTVPMLIADLNADGYYDSVYLDISTVYYYLNEAYLGSVTFPGAPDQPDFSFADETPITYDNPIAARDFDGDGYYDISIGTLAGFVYDALGVIAAEESGYIAANGGYYYPATDVAVGSFEYAGAIWPGLDFWNGRYAVIHYDFYSHGTFVATTAAGRPVEAYVGYAPGNETGVALVAGQAPSAKIASANALFAGSVMAALYFFSGYWPATPYGYGYWIPAGGTNPFVGYDGTLMLWSKESDGRVDVTNNSWGVSEWAIWGWASGMDPLSIVVDYLSLTSSTAHFVAAGNGGPGWGTVTTPGASALAVTVGAATEFTYLAIYGALPGGNSQVVTWSNRGPSEAGYPKPDIVAIGSFAWAVGRVWESLYWGVMSGRPEYVVDLFGGTSQATPMAAGVAALVIDAFKAVNGVPAEAPNPLGPQMLKVVLASSARDIGFDPLSQGAGFVDAYKAVLQVMGAATSDPLVVVDPGDAARQYARIMGIPVDALPSGFPASSIAYVGRPGSYERVKLHILGEGKFRVKAVSFANELLLDRRTVTVDFVEQVGYLVPLAVYDADRLARRAGDGILEFRIWFPFKYFDSRGRQQYGAEPLGWSWLHEVELFYWIDLDRDGAPSIGEVTRIQYDVRGGNMLHLQVADLGSEIAEIDEIVADYLGINPAEYPRRVLVAYYNPGNAWDAYTDSLPVPITLEVKVYKATATPYVRPVKSFIISRGYDIVEVAVIAPGRGGTDTGFIVVENVDTGEKTLIPYFTAAAKPVSASPVDLSVAREKGFYKDYSLRGAFDYFWRYESGDWRVYFFEVKDPRVKAVVVEVRWPQSRYGMDYTSNVDVQVYGPYTYYLANTDEYPMPVIAAVLPGLHRGGELTSSNYIFFYDEPAPGRSIIVVEVDQPGIYRLVVRNIHYSGDAAEERIRVKVYPVLASQERFIVPPGADKRLTLRLASVYNFAGGGYFYTGEAIVETPGGQLYYVVDSADAGLYYSIASAVITGRTATLLVDVQVDPAVEKGTSYLVPIFLQTRNPVTSLGYIDWSGVKYELFYYDIIAVKLAIDTSR